MRSSYIWLARFAQILVLITFTTGAAAHEAGDPPHQRFELGDFELETGKTIRNAFLTYVTHGELNDEASNAVLVLPSLMANHHRHDFLIGPGKALDPNKHYIIAADTLGNGQAVSPSNSEDQPTMEFPQFNIRDMVAAQHALVTEGLDLDRLKAVVGLSMGGMQTYQWLVSHPEMMDAAVPIITMARTTGWVTAIWESHRRAIMAAEGWNGGNYETPPEDAVRAMVAGLLPWTRHWKWFDAEFRGENQSAIDWLKNVEDQLVEIWDPANYVYQTRAEDLHDVGETPGVEGYYDALQSIEAKVLLMPSKTDLLHPSDNSYEALRYIPDARMAEIPSFMGHIGGGGAHPADVEFMNKTIADFLAGLD